MGRHFTIYTDHKPLKGIANLRDKSSRLARFHYKLAEYDFEIRYKAGKKNQNADALSRIPYASEEVLLVQTRARKSAEQGRLSETETQGKLDRSKHDIQKEKTSGQVVEDVQEDHPVELHDSKDIETVLKDFHDNPLGGHQGVSKTLCRLKRQFRWKGMKKDVTRHVRKCLKCQKSKSSRKTLMPMVITDTPIRPFSKIYMDCVGPLPESSSENKLILTIQDDFSKYMVCAAMKDGEASTVARTFVTEWIAKFGIPGSIVTDNGTNFMSQVFSDTCKFLGIKKLNTTPYLPQANGSLERSHAPLAAYLRSFVTEDGKNWDQWLPMAMHVHNNTKHAATGQTPFRTLYGFDLEVPSNLKRNRSPLYNPDDPSKVLKFQFQRAHELVRENLINAKKASKGYYDRKIKPISFIVGEKVLLRNQNRKNKFSEIWTGPYVVTRVVSPVTTVIRVKGKSRKWHNNHLHKFYEE